MQDHKINAKLDMVKISKPTMAALLLATILIIGSTLAVGHGHGGAGRGGSPGGFDGHTGSRSAQGGGGASNTVPRRDGYGVTVSRLIEAGKSLK